MTRRGGCSPPHLRRRARHPWPPRGPPSLEYSKIGHGRHSSLTCGSCGYPQGRSRPQLRDVRRLDEYNQTILRKLKDLGSVIAMSEEEDKQKWLWKMVSSQLNPYILICFHKILIFLTKNYGELKSL